MKLSEISAQISLELNFSCRRQTRSLQIIGPRLQKSFGRPFLVVVKTNEKISTHNVHVATAITVTVLFYSRYLMIR